MVPAGYLAKRCLLHSLEQARTLLENGTFNNSEPGPYRIFVVYSLYPNPCFA